MVTESKCQGDAAKLIINDSNTSAYFFCHGLNLSHAVSNGPIMADIIGVYIQPGGIEFATGVCGNTAYSFCQR